MPDHLKAAFWGAMLGLGLCLAVSGCLYQPALAGACISSCGVFLAGIAFLACVDLERGDS